jgi:hypothetical protein
LQGLEVLEIAEKLGEPVGTVGGRWQSIVRKMDLSRVDIVRACYVLDHDEVVTDYFNGLAERRLTNPSLRLRQVREGVPAGKAHGRANDAPSEG